MNLKYYTDEFGCWIPISHAKDKDGYVLYKGKRAHQVMFERVNGKIPKGMVVRHTCNRGHLGCCAPNHLILGSQYDNVQDRVEAGRSARGEANGNSKLSDEQVAIIRESDKPATALAAEFGVSASLVRAIRRGDRRGPGKKISGDSTSEPEVDGAEG